MQLNFWDKFVRWVYRCWRDPVKRLALVAAVVTLSCFGLLAGPPYFSTASVPARWSFDPGLEVQTVTDAEDLRLTLGDAPSQDRETMRIKVKIDFAFILAYVAFLVSLGVLAAQKGGWRRAAGVAVALCALAIGVFDVLENLAILDILDVRIADTTSTLLDAIRTPARIKWSLAAVCAVLVLLSHYESFTRSTVSDSVRSDKG
ncbi:MAG: hypothetical protein ABIR70_18105 [Bryobacteraceae bacterium]